MRLYADFRAFLSCFLSPRSTDNTPSTDNTTLKTLVSDEDTRESENFFALEVGLGRELQGILTLFV